MLYFITFLKYCQIATLYVELESLNIYSNACVVQDIYEILYLEKCTKYKYVVDTNNKVKHIISCFSGNILKIDVKKIKLKKLKNLNCSHNLIIPIK